MESKIQRFISLIQKGSPDDCWIWLGSKDRAGYGYLNYGNKSDRAHRFSYEYFNNEKIPFGKVIDHLCNNPSCVNPNHLKAVTPYENTMRGNGVGAKAFRQTHCHKGHLLSGKNTFFYRKKNGRTWRYCRECRKLNQRAYVLRKKKKPIIT